MPEADIIKQSVTAGDYADNPRGGVMNFMVPWYPGAATGLPPEPPVWWSRARDYALRSTVLYEDMWAAAIGIAITKVASSSWEIDSEIPIRARRGQDILNDSDIVKLWAKGLRDYLTTDNGQFIEIVRVAKSPVSRIIALTHLDSLRCTRTGDPEIPVIYVDRKNHEHEIRAENVIALSDMPDPGDTWFGVGNCAASRAYRSIYKLSVIDRYVSEKVSGRRPLALYFVNAVSRTQLQNAMLVTEENNAAQGILSYMGAVVIPLMDASTPPQVSTVPLAELPDRFNRKEEFDIALYSYADNIGLDIQDLQPLTGQPLGTGAQSQVLDEKAKGKGLVIWKKDLAYELNMKVYDDYTTFTWIEKDYRDQERQAGVSKARADASKVRVDAGITTPAQELQVLVDLDELPNEFLPEDVTGETLSDDEKPDMEQSNQAPDLPQTQPEVQPTEGAPTEATAKEVTQSDLDALFTKELNAAIELYQDTGGKMPDVPGMKETVEEVVLSWFKAGEGDGGDGEDEEDPGPFKTARQRKWFFAQGPGTEGGNGKGGGKSGDGGSTRGGKEKPKRDKNNSGDLKPATVNQAEAARQGLAVISKKYENRIGELNAENEVLREKAKREIEKIEKEAEKKVGNRYQTSEYLTRDENGNIVTRTMTLETNEYRAAKRELFRERVEPIYAEVEKNNLELASIRENARAEMTGLLRVDDPMNFDVTSGRFKDQTRIDAINTGTSEVEKLASASVFGDVPVKFVPGGSGRAHVEIGSTQVSMTSGSGTVVVVHELGHVLEHNNPEVRQRVFDFYDKRTQSSNLITMNRATKIRSGYSGGYRSYEKTRVDNFIHPYMGKSYTYGNGERYATEILSMGLQSFYENPYGLATGDPEYFDFMYNLLRGK